MGVRRGLYYYLMLRALSGLFLAALLVPAYGSGQDGGMLPSWEVEELAQQMGEEADKTRLIVEELRPKEWIQDGASSAFVDEHEALVRELEYLRRVAVQLEDRPESLTVAMDTFFWLERLQSMTRSLAGGSEQYQSAALAELLRGANGRIVDHRDTIKTYMRQLAADREEALAVAHDEAQRCRSIMLRSRGR